jgi:hypothetical protein
MPVTNYSTTPSSNNSAAPNGAPEGMAPGSVNDTIRQIMADIAVEAQTNAVKKLGSVSGADTITASMSPALTAYATSMLVLFTPAGTNTTTVTLAINGLSAKAIVKHNNVALIAGDLKAAVPALCVYDGTSFVLLNPLLAHTANADAAEPGFKGLPQNAQTTNYGLVLSDSSKHIYCTGSLTQVTVPANASVAFPIGTVIVIANNTDASITIAITSDTLVLEGTTSTGSRTLADNSSARLLKVTSTAWWIIGTGLT